MMRLVDTAEAAQIRGVSPRTIERWFEAGKIPGHFVSGKRGGKNGLKLMVEIDEGQEAIGKRQEAEVKIPEPACAKASGGKPMVGTARVNRGSPGCDIITEYRNGEPILNSTFVTHIPQNQTGCHERQGMGDRTSRATPVCDPRPPEQADGRECSASTGPTPAHIANTQAEDPQGCAPAAPGEIEQKYDAPRPQAQAPSAPVIPSPPGETGADAEPSCAQGASEGKQSNLPIIYNDTLRQAQGERRIPESCQKVANLRFALLQKFNEESLKNHRPKTQIIREFLDLYNGGFLLPNVHEEIGDISRATLYNWAQIGRDHGIEGLVPQYGGAGGSSVTEAEIKFLRSFLLQQNHPPIGTAIRYCKDALGDSSPSAPATLRRWVSNFKKLNYDLWVQEREGSKALNDKCVMYAERDWRVLSVGEGLVADGHKLNFQVIHPRTGKPTRAILVLFWDWYSSYPLGWEIMLTENIQSISTALRNAILTLGKIPKWVLLDNGRAFRADVFTSKLKLQETELPGMFMRLGINAYFSRPYNAQAKPVERFFRVFGDWFERLLPSFTGASIDDKPAGMLRNEKRARRLRGEWVPEIEQVNDMLHQWREFYAGQSLKGRDGHTSRELFEPGKGAGVDPRALCFLMMAMEIRTVHRNGITWNGWHWYNSALYGYRDKVIVRYSLSDFSRVYIFDISGQFLCDAAPVEKVHPMGAESEFPKDHEDAKRIGAEQARQKKETKQLADLLRRNDQQIPWNGALRKNLKLVEYIQEEEKKKDVRLSPFVEEPESTVHSPHSTEERRTELSGPPLRHESELYDWYLAQDPAALNQADLQWIEDYKQTSEWRNYYGQKQASGL